MATKASPHPCERGKAFDPWKEDHLYIDDDGRIACGRCMGISSTYKPWAYSDLGQMTKDRTVTMPPMWIELGPGQKVLQGAITYRCETDQFANH